MPLGADEVAGGILEALVPFLLTWVLVDLQFGLFQERVRRWMPLGADEVAAAVL